jgi:hypothetical protein
VEKLIIESGDYRISLADSEHQCSEVAMLIRRMYSWRGYAIDGASAPTPAANRAILQVRRDRQTVATMTLRFDSAEGLLADGLYRNELDAVRRFGANICELTGLAIAPQEDSPAVLNALFQSAYVLGAEYAISDVVIEVNPRHAAHYQRLLGFRLAGPERRCHRVGAPAVLLHLDLNDLEERLDEAAAGSGINGSAGLVGLCRQPYRSFVRFAAVACRGPARAVGHSVRQAALTSG